jgi:hypothetical protein
MQRILISVAAGVVVAAMIVIAHPAYATPSRSNNGSGSVVGNSDTVSGSGGTITVGLTAGGAGNGPASGTGGAGNTAPTPPPPVCAGPTIQTNPLQLPCGSSNCIPCPPPPQSGGSIVAGATTTLQRQLPQPQLTVQPGYAVTGLTAYLQIGTPDNLAFTFPGFHNAVSVVCSWDHFDVNWGDGTDDPDVRSTGGPYPDGDVTHVYQQASASDDLHVVEYWSCPWHDQLGGAGVLQLQTANDLFLEVREVQTLNG